MRTTTSLLLNIVTSLCLGACFLLALDATRALSQPLKVTQTSHFELVSGSSLNGMTQAMQEQGLFQQSRDGLYLRLFGRVTGIAASLQAGEYRIEPETSPFDLVQAMRRGDVVEYGFTIVEGWTLQQVLQNLARHPQIKPGSTPDTPAVLKEHFSIEQQNPEGWFYPDTYLFTKGTSGMDVLRRAHAAMLTTLEEEWEQREDKLPYKSAYEALIMASIIEKETAVGSERQQIAGVFVRRLEKGMRLQTDPTVIYGMGDAYDGNIRRTDLLRATPYNTYTQYGLPPTPIALPGRASIHAALHPEPGETLYFVSRGDGSHEFSATLEAHNAAVRQYQLGKPEPAKTPAAQAQE